MYIDPIQKAEVCLLMLTFSLSMTWPRVSLLRELKLSQSVR